MLVKKNENYLILILFVHCKYTLKTILFYNEKYSFVSENNLLFLYIENKLFSLC